MIGHDKARTYLERHLPTATLLLGPASIGKWTLSNHLADHHHVAISDRWVVPGGLTIDTVRLVAAFARRAPVGQFKLIQARLDHASKAALNALLKTLEEPPPYVRFLLTSARQVQPTVRSRCTVFELGTLSRDELEQIYLSQGLPPRKAAKAAQLAEGQVIKGYDAEEPDTHRNQVVALAKALSSHDRELFDAVFRTWDARNTQLLHNMLIECMTQRWTTFTADEAFGLDRHRPRLVRMVIALRVLSGARPRLGVRAALEPFLSLR